jgi:Subtilase family
MYARYGFDGEQMLPRTAMTSLSLLAVGGLIATAPLGAAAAAHSHSVAAKAAKPTKGGRVIIVLKDQPRSASLARIHGQAASASAIRAEQRGVASSVRGAGGTVRSSLTIVNAIAATVTSAEATKLARRSDVAEVIPDARIKEAAPTVSTTKATAAAPAPIAPPAGTCPANPQQVQLEPEVLDATHTDSSAPGAKTARSLGYTGAGVTVGYMAEGIDINNPDFTRNGHTIFSAYKDFSGDGPNADTSGGEAFLDASAIAAQGNTVYNLQNFSDLGLNRPCLIRVEGEAPGVNLVGLKVFSNGFSSTSGFLEAINYAVNTAHVNVLNQSFGSNFIPDSSQDVIRAADDAAVAKGVTVTVSTGDAGLTNTIGTPADDPNVIAVGASTTFRFYLQVGYAGARLPGIKSWKSNNISSLSSGGFNQAGGSVTLVAPGDLNYAVCSTNITKYADCTDYAGNPIGIEASGGTSESAPTVAGVAALVIQAYKQGHNGAVPSPAVIKSILTSTAQDIDAPADQQGAGLVDAYQAVQLAKAYGAGPATGSVLSSSASTLSAVAAPKTPQTFTDTVTNRGTATQTIAVGSRTLGAYSRIATTQVTLSDANSPKYVDFQGITDNYQKVTFTVPAGEDRMFASIAYQSADITDLGTRDRMTLVDPTGALVGYSLPQGLGNYGHAEVANPVPGTWTAYIQSRDGANGGSVGVVHFAAGVAKWERFGSVSPSSLTLAPGKSGTVTLHVDTKAAPGDLAGSIDLASAGNDTTVPVTMRSVIPAGKQSFTQILTGGNGRDEFPGDVYSYAVTVPKGTPELNAAVRLTDDANNPFEASLVSPGGNATAFAANTLLTGTDGDPMKGLQLHSLAPTPGMWTLVVDFAPVVSGNNISTPFTVTTDDRARTATAAGLPDSTKTVLTAGKTTAYQVKIVNTGPSAESFFVDPRLNSSATYTLGAQFGADATAPISDNLPEYLVPADTTAIRESAATTGTWPIQFDSQSPIGDPDLPSSEGLTASLSYFAGPVTPGAWDIAPAEVGPFSSQVPTEDVSTAMTAKTLAFDRTMKSSTGDLWLESLNANAFLSTVTVGSGQTAVINVKITPTAGAHTVHGTLFVDDANLLATSYNSFFSPNANQVAAIPYSYRVK